MRAGISTRGLLLWGVALGVACDGASPSSRGSRAGTPDEMSATERAELPGEIVFVSEHRGQLDVAAVVPATGATRKLTGGERAYAASGAPALAIVTSGPDDEHVEQLALLSPDGGAVRRIGPRSSRVRNPSWGPDGRWLVIESDIDSFRDLYRVDVATGESARLTTRGDLGNFEPSVSADGRWIAFSSSRDRNSEIYVMPSSGGEEIRLTAAPLDDWAPAWSPAGDAIAFLSERADAARVFVMRPDGRGQRAVAPRDDPDAHDDAFVWSPDGTRIAHLVRRLGAPPELWVVDVAAGAGRRVSPEGWGCGPPSWSPDGRYLAFDAERARNADIYVVRADGSAIARVTRAPAAEWLPRWVSAVAPAPGGTAASTTNNGLQLAGRGPR